MSGQRPRCGICGRGQDEVPALVVGAGAAICTPCVWALAAMFPAPAPLPAALMARPAGAAALSVFAGDGECG